MNSTRKHLAILITLVACLAYVTWSWVGNKVDHSAPAASNKAAPSARSLVAAAARSGKWTLSGHEHCRWHQGLKLNSADWWLAQYGYTPADAQSARAARDGLELEIESMETAMIDAVAATRKEIDAAVADELGRELQRGSALATSVGPEAATKQGDDSKQFILCGVRKDGRIEIAVRRPPPSEGWLRLIASTEERLSLDAAFEREFTLHDEAPKRLQDMIRSFK